PVLRPQAGPVVRPAAGAGDGPEGAGAEAAGDPHGVPPAGPRRRGRRVRAHPRRPAADLPAGMSLPRVLYLTHRVPFPPDKGDRIRNYHLLRGLAARGRVWLGCLADEPVTDAARAELDRYCECVAVVPAAGKRKWLRAGWSVLTGGSI